MANIVVIESDPRVLKQIKQYIGELADADDHKVRYFDSQEAFEARYFNKKNQKEESPLLKLAPLNQWSQVHVDWMLERKLEDSAPFPGEKLKIVLSTSALKISKTEPAVSDEDIVFGQTMAQLKEVGDPFKQAIGSAFRPIYQDLVQKTIDRKPVSNFSFPVSAGDSGRFWIVSAELELDEGNMVLSFKNETETVRSVFDEEKKKFADDANKEGVELDLLASIDLMIVKLPLIKNFRKGFVSQTLKQIRDFGYLPASQQTKFMILKYEDDGTKKIDLLDPRISDLIFLPLDRVLFLQKLDIILSEPELISPKYLFQQDVEMDITISKRTFIEYISDIGIGVRNPMALKPGLMAHFFFEFPGEEETHEVYGKVQKSIPHPEIDKLFIVYFTFAAIPRATLTKVRRFLSQNPRYSNLKSEDKEQFQYNPDNVFSDEKSRRVKNVIVINPDEKMIQQISGNINEHFDQVRVVGDTSYSHFLKKYFAGNEEEESEVAESPIDLESTRPATKEDLGGEALIFYVHSQSYSIMAPLPPSEDSGMQILGHEAHLLLSHSDEWLKILFPLDDSKDEIKEALGAAWMGRTVSKTVILRNKAMDPKAAIVKMEKRSDDDSIKVIFEPASEKMVKEKVLLEAPISTFDCIVIDSHFVPEDIGSWIQGLTDYCRLKAMLPEDKKLKVIVMGDEDSKLDPNEYSHTNIVNVCQAPLDTRAFLVHISLATNNDFSIYNFENISWLDSRISVHIAKPVKLLKISEFGGSVGCPVPISPGTFLFVRGNIFDQAPRGNLCVRFYGSEKCEDGPYKYKCHMLYFGINESFMKFARSWFRETYAASKQG